jgi:hypothetical protein
MKYFFILLSSVFLFSGCASTQCGVEEQAFNRLSKTDQLKICSAYSKEQAKIRRIEAENEARRLKLEQTKVESLYHYKTPSEHSSSVNTNVVNISIISGSFKPYGRLERVTPQEFQLANGEVKKVCIFSDRGSRSCMWVSYQGSRVLWNIVPDYGKVNYNSYVDMDLINTFYPDRSTYVSFSRNWFRGNYDSVHINGKYRSSDMNLKVYFSYSGGGQTRIQYR